MLEDTNSLDGAQLKDNFLHQKTCGHSLESPHWGERYRLTEAISPHQGSSNECAQFVFLWWGDFNEYPQHMFLWRNKKSYP